jgi:membrane protease YdiL (CAAX protease family)
MEVKNRVLAALVAAAFVLWFITFYVEAGNFWLKIGVSVFLLASSVLVFKPSLRRPEWKNIDVLWGVGSAAVLYGVFWAGNEVCCLLFSFAPDQVGSIYDKGTGTPSWSIVLLLLLVTGPGEEIFWRGFLQGELAARWGGFRGFVVATALYALVHVSSLNFMLVGAAGVAGGFWGLMYWRLGRLWPLIISHSLWSAYIFAMAPIR